MEKVIKTALRVISEHSDNTIDKLDDNTMDYILCQIREDPSIKKEMVDTIIFDIITSPEDYQRFVQIATSDTGAVKHKIRSREDCEAGLIACGDLCIKSIAKVIKSRFDL